MIGQRVGRLIVVKEVDKLILPSGQANRAFLCRCDCGEEKIVRKVHLSNNRIRSCGCLKKTRGGKGTNKLLKVWRQMNSRCRPDYFQKHLYYDKGIRVSEIWRSSYKSFEEWSIKNGYAEGLVIDRKNNSKGYDPDNCRWISQLVNSSNKDNTIMVAYYGELKALKLIVTEKKMRQHYEAILRRIKRGWEPQKAIDTPIRCGAYKRSRTKEEIDFENELMFSKL
ncbi:hypothetical protein ATE47_04110 [Chryseobacterium sp. IHB B 17019]|uniref:hypothetical protein n=1 Tax=Chryseobacterium sp. IHB B 17019 TaxID=1721091 RepID=UPI000722E775|nr:hypothetical protein [Chryseobacterium sp. IHB B 17019]ALR29754.1 hypothetical protein ATE47_04110 [Chryseobacterium sp. IHB B 17019]